MVNYRNGKIYRIVNVQNETIYIGSTGQSLANRLSTHAHKGNGNKIVLIKACPCSCREELVREEQQVIEEHQKLANMVRAYRNPERKKEYIAEDNKVYREKNKERLAEYHKRWWEANKERKAEQRREKVECELCGCCVCKRNLKQHQRTKKCMALAQRK